LRHSRQISANLGKSTNHGLIQNSSSRRQEALFNLRLATKIASRLTFCKLVNAVTVFNVRRQDARPGHLISSSSIMKDNVIMARIHQLGMLRFADRVLTP
jgi:hypothetical protein